MRTDPARTEEPAPGALWSNPDFVKFWAGQSISMFGTYITDVALPLLVVITLRASPTQAGLVSAARFAPFLVVSLFAGVWIDRVRRRRVLIVTDLGRALLLGLIPFLALIGRLGIGSVVLIAFLTGMLTVFFDVGYLSYVPSVVGLEELPRANGTLEVSRSTAQLAGPGLAGVLVKVVGAPVAILIDAVSYLVSAGSLVLIRRREEVPARTQGRTWEEIGEGLRFVFRNVYLRALVLQATAWNFFNQMIVVVVVLFILRSLHLGPVFVGLYFSAGSAGGLLGAVVSVRVTRQLGFGRGLLSAIWLDSLAPILVPLASGPKPVAAAVLLLSSFLWGLGLVIANVNIISLRQSATPDRLLGRMNASYRLLAYGAIPLGALLGGLLASWIGFRATLWVAAIGMPLSVAFVLFSPIPSLVRPATASDPVAGGPP
jgi:MFS family permease